MNPGNIYKTAGGVKEAVFDYRQKRPVVTPAPSELFPGALGVITGLTIALLLPCVAHMETEEAGPSQGSISRRDCWSQPLTSHCIALSLG